MSNEPSGFAEYPRPAFNLSPNQYGRGPGIYFDTIGESYNIVKQDFGPWILATILYFVVGFAISFPVSFAMEAVLPSLAERGQTGFAIGFLLVQFAVNLLVVAIQGSFLVGMVLMAVRKSRGEPIKVGMMFEPIQKLGTILGSNILYWVITYLSLLACIVPLLFFAPVLYFAPIIAYMRDQGAFQSIKTSFNTFKSHWTGLFGLFFVLGCLQVVGALACGVGLLVTWPMFCVVVALHYRAFFESDPSALHPLY